MQFVNLNVREMQLRDIWHWYWYIFNCSWIDTLWQQYSTLSHKNNT